MIKVKELKEFLNGLPPEYDELGLSITFDEKGETDMHFEFNPDLMIIENAKGVPTLLDFDIGDIDELDYVEDKLLPKYKEDDYV